ncbi:unnamed protein product, partial [Symbiodinium necroappetens]
GDGRLAGGSRPGSRAQRPYYKVRIPEMLLPSLCPVNDVTRVRNMGKPLQSRYGTLMSRSGTGSMPALPATPSASSSCLPLPPQPSQPPPAQSQHFRLPAGTLGIVSQVAIQYAVNPLKDSRLKPSPRYELPLEASPRLARRKSAEIPLEELPLPCRESIADLTTSVSQVLHKPTVALKRSMHLMDGLQTLRCLGSSGADAASRSPTISPRSQEETWADPTSPASLLSLQLTAPDTTPVSVRRPKASEEGPTEEDPLLIAVLKDVQDSSQSLLLKMKRIEEAQSMVKRCKGTRHPTNLVTDRVRLVIERKASLLRQVEDRMAEFQACVAVLLCHSTACPCHGIILPNVPSQHRHCAAVHGFTAPGALAQGPRPSGSLQRKCSKCWAAAAILSGGWVAAVLGKKLQRSSDEQASRAFWLARERRCQMHGGTNDSPMELIRGVLSRKQPLKATSLYLLYCSSVTASFMHCRHYAASGQPWFVEEVAHMAQYIMESHDVMQTCTGFLATALFMTLSFRMNRAATRWWHGREMCANLLSSARSLGQEAQLCCNDKASAMELSLLGYAFVRSAEFHVRLEPPERYVEAFVYLLPKPILEDLLAAPHRPYFLTQRLTSRLADAYDAGHTKNVRLVVAVQNHVNKLAQIMEDMETLRSTPEPWGYQKHNALLMQLWLAILPVALTPTLLWATPLLGASIGYAVYKLEDVAVEICNPFGMDNSDISLCIMNDRFQQELLAALQTWLQHDSRVSVVIPQLPSEVAEKMDEVCLKKPALCRLCVYFAVFG